MADYEMKIEGVEELLKKTKDSKILQAPFRKFFEESGKYVEGEVTMLTPVGVSGDLRASIHHFVDSSPVPLFGIIDSRLSPHYAPDVEFGTRPHMPPHDAIYRWAWLNRGKFDINRKSRSQKTKDKVESLTQRIRWKIYRYGTKGQFMFKRGLEKSKNKIRQLASDMLKSIGEEWSK